MVRDNERFSLCAAAGSQALRTVSGALRNRTRSETMSDTLRTIQRDDSNTVLLVSDDGDTVPCARAAFDTAETDAAFQFARSPEEALARVRGRGEHEGAALPDIVLLDLDMDGEAGYETLAAIRDDPDLKRLPVIALATSPEREEVVRSYEAKANACMRKPTDEESFAEVISAVDQFWLQRVKLPPLSR